MMTGEPVSFPRVWSPPPATDGRAYTRHEFVLRLARGDLPEAAFRRYLVQDYLFLLHFARAWGLAIYKSDTLSEMRRAQSLVAATLDVEIGLHIEYCRRWGLSEAAMNAEPEALETVAYTRFVLDRGLAGDRLDLEVALAPCVIGYAEIARERMADPATRRDGNPYRDWLDMYEGAEYQDLAREAEAALDEQFARRGGEGRFPALAAAFATATRLEADFWQMGLAGAGIAAEARPISICPATLPITGSSSRCRAASTRRSRRRCWRAPGSMSSASHCSFTTTAPRRARKGACCAGQDVRDAARVAERLGIPHYVLDYEARFREAVIEDFAESYRRGETPIPCIRCNERDQVPRPVGNGARSRRRRAGDRALRPPRRRAGRAGTAPRPRSRARPELFSLPHDAAPNSIFCAFRSAALAKDETRALARELRPAGRREARQPGHLLRAARLLCRYGQAAAPGSRRARRHRRRAAAGCSAGIAGSRISRSASARGSASPPPSRFTCCGSTPRRAASLSARRAALAETRVSLAEMNWLAPPPAPAPRSVPAQTALGAAAGRGDVLAGERRRCRTCSRRAGGRGRAGSGGGALRRRPGARRRLDPPPGPRSAAALDPRGPSPICAGRPRAPWGGVAQLVRAGES